jgi:hypothetical protein
MHNVAHRRRFRDDPEEYTRKLSEQRENNHIREDVPVFLLDHEVLREAPDRARRPATQVGRK